MLDLPPMTANDDPPIRSEETHDYLYARIASRLRKQIAEGGLVRGARLPSLDDLAELHGVNRLTVRKAIVQLRDEGLVYSVPAQGNYVSKTAGGRVEEEARSPMIGLLSHVLNPAGYGPYHQSIISGVYDELGKCEANLLVMAAGMVKPADFPGMVRRARVDGMVYMGPFDGAMLSKMVMTGPPAVVVDYQVAGINCDSICVDNAAGAAEAVRHLMSRGYGGNIAVISGMVGDTSTEERTAGVKRAFAEAGVPFGGVRMVPGNYMREGGESAMLALMQGGKLPRALFCMNDEMAVGAMTVLQHAGYSIPGDVAVVGFDDTIWAESTNPQLTTVHVDTRQMGQMAMRLLWSRMHHRDMTPMLTVMQPKVVVRGTT